MLTARSNSLRPGWAEPVGSRSRPHTRRRRTVGALGALTFLVVFPLSASGAPRSASLAPLAESASPPTDPQVVALDAFPVEPRCAFWNTFGASRDGGARAHEGIDIGADEGKEVYAARAGTISRIYLDSATNRGGNSFRLTAADGTYFFYGHLSAFADGLRVGQKVNAGDVLGYVGHTGNAGGVNHLHFEIHPGGGSAIDGYDSLRAIDACRKPAVAPATTVPATAAPKPAAEANAPASTAPAKGAPKAPPSTVGKAAAPTTAPKGASPAPGAAAAAPASPATTGAAVPSTATRLSIAPPTRVVNSGGGLGPKAQAARRTSYQVLGVNGVPTSATLVLLNVTAAFPAASGYLTVLPCSAGSGESSTLNFRAGFADSTSALVAPVDGRVCVETSATTHVIIDVVGYDGDWSAGVTSIRPTHLLDTTTLVPGEPLAVKASGVGGVPPSNGVSITVSSSNPAGAGTITAYACDKLKPKVAQVTVGGGPNSTGVNTRLAADGTFCLVSSVRVDVSVDATAAWALGGSNKLRAVTPVRAYDSRPKGTVSAGQVVQLVIADDELPWKATVAEVVIVATNAAEQGTVTAWPCGQAKPATTAVTATPGRTASASVFVGLGGGKLCLSPSTAMDLIVDVTGGA